MNQTDMIKMMFFHKILLAAFLFGVSSSVCFSQDVILNSQTQVDAFSNGITVVNGDLTIETTFDDDPITNLSNLINLTTIVNRLNIGDNLVLTNLDGLNNITVVGQHLSVYNNAALTNIDALANLTSLGGSLTIFVNPALTTLNGLLGLTTIPGGVEIFNNNGLADVGGLENLTSIGEGLLISDNDILADFDGFANLNSIGGVLYINDNENLTNCCGIQELLSTPNAIGGLITIFNNPMDCNSEAEIISKICFDMDVWVIAPCLGIDNGAIHVQTAWGTAPFTFAWQRIEDGQTGAGDSSDPDFLINELSAGTYDLNLIDAQGRTIFKEDIVIVLNLPEPVPLTIETCEEGVVTYNGMTLSIGDNREFVFQDRRGCDSIVSVTVVGVSEFREDVNLGACTGKTVDYNGMALAAGDVQDFTFQNSTGCDSIVTVTVEEWPTSVENLTLEVCAGLLVDYQNSQLAIGAQRAYVFESIHGCDSIVQVNVIEKGAIGKNIAPNIFSPNNDGANDCFRPFFGDQIVYENYKLNIYNRWGELVFRTNNSYDCWDGELKGRPMENGVYIWLIEIATEVCTQPSVFTGDVTLIR